MCSCQVARLAMVARMKACERSEEARVRDWSVEEASVALKGYEGIPGAVILF